MMAAAHGCHRVFERADLPQRRSPTPWSFGAGYPGLLEKFAGIDGAKKRTTTF